MLGHRQSCTRSRRCAVSAAMALNVLLLLLGVVLAGDDSARRVRHRRRAGRQPRLAARRAAYRSGPAARLEGNSRPPARPVRTLCAAGAVRFLCRLVALLALGFGLMAYAARSHFEPPLESFAEALYTVGSAMMTVGPGSAETVPWRRPLDHPRRGLLRARRDDHGRHLPSEVQSSIARARHRDHQAQHLCGRPAVRPHHARTVRGDSQPGTGARCACRKPQLVRDRPPEPLRASVADLFPVGRNRRRLAGRARRHSRPRASSPSTYRRR